MLQRCQHSERRYKDCCTKEAEEEMFTLIETSAYWLASFICHSSRSFSLSMYILKVCISPIPSSCFRCTDKWDWRWFYDLLRCSYTLVIQQTTSFEMNCFEITIRTGVHVITQVQIHWKFVTPNIFQILNQSSERECSNATTFEDFQDLLSTGTNPRRCK